MSIVYVKTAAGQLQIRERSLALARPARTMLVLVDGTRSRDQVTAMVQGATPEDFDSLVGHGLITPGASASAPKRPSAVETAAPAAEPAAPAAVSDLGYRELYDSLTALAKDQLGLIKGYRFALEIEKARDLAELQQVAQRFVVEVSKAKGESAAQATRRALGLTR